MGVEEAPEIGCGHFTSTYTSVAAPARDTMGSLHHVQVTDSTALVLLQTLLVEDPGAHSAWVPTD